jgi:hypothetical protein
MPFTYSQLGVEGAGEEDLRSTRAGVRPFLHRISSPNCPTMKLFHILLILAVAIIGVFADDQCIVNCVEYGAADCYVGYGNPLIT